ncbi:FAR1 DNA-binding domain [Sesbania bispinosa]|nr:FAR1 DNA-binding domain [Sesbania bispinosa]
MSFVKQMDKCDFESTIHLDEDKDPVFDCSFDDSLSSGEYIKLCEKNEKQETDIGDGECKRMFELSVDEMLSKEFASEEEAYEFYKLYARHHGFVVRKDDVTKDLRGNHIMRQFVCNGEGLRNKKHFMRGDRKKEHRPLTRTNCLARLRVHYHHKSLK